jgi:hypothetical protein
MCTQPMSPSHDDIRVRHEKLRRLARRRRPRVAIPAPASRADIARDVEDELVRATEFGSAA